MNVGRVEKTEHGITDLRRCQIGKSNAETTWSVLDRRAANDLGPRALLELHIVPKV
jgi:hypothetical protein